MALVMAASAVKICSRKKGKAKGPSELEKDTVGILYKTRAGKSGVTRISRNKMVAAW